MSNPKILIVDDQPFNIDYLEQELEEDYLTVTAMDGQEALDQVAAEKPDLVLLDIMMPIMDGFEVLARLKADPATRGIPVIVISADNNLNSVVRGIQLGAEDYLPKPFEPVLLHTRITTCLEKKRLSDLQALYLKSLEREMEIARQIQGDFLPSELPQVPGCQVAAYFKAAREVAGDYYDAFVLSDGTLVGVVGDVCGKGVGAALYMTLFRSLIRVTCTTDVHPSQGKTSPAERLRLAVTFTNRYITETHGDADMFSTLFICLVNHETGGITYINAGNEAPYLRKSDGSLTSLGPTGPVVGVIPEAKYAVRETRLEAGDLLLAFTDGIPDSKNDADEFFGHDRLEAILTSTPAASPSDLLAGIQAQLHQFIGSAEQFDDITVLGIQFQPPA